MDPNIQAILNQLQAPEYQTIQAQTMSMWALATSATAGPSQLYTATSPEDMQIFLDGCIAAGRVPMGSPVLDDHNKWVVWYRQGTPQP